MSNKKQKKSRKQKNRMKLTFIKFAIVVVIMGWFGVTYVRLDRINLKYSSELENLDKELDKKKRDLNVKKTQMAYYNTDEYMEKIAREEIDLVMPNDLVFYINN